MSYIIATLIAVLHYEAGFAKSKDIVVTPKTDSTTQPYDDVVKKIREHLKTEQTNLAVKKEVQKEKEKEKEKDKITATINCEQENNFAKVTLKLSVQAPIAIFRDKKDWYICIAYPTDCLINEIDFDKIYDLTAINDTPIETGHIIKISLGRNLAPEIQQKDSELELTFKPNVMINDNGPSLIDAPSRIGEPYRLNIPRKTAQLSFEDEETNKKYVILCTSEQTKSVQLYNYPEFNLLESLRGFAFEILSDSLDYQIIKKSFEIRKPKGIANSLAYMKEPVVDNVSLFSDFDSKSAPAAINALNQNTKAQNQKQISTNILTIWYYLGLGKIPEAAALINRLKESSSDVSLIPAFTALDGLTDLLANRPEKAELSLNSICYDTEPFFWRLIALANKNVFVDSEQFFKIVNYKDKILLLPPPLRDRLLLQLLMVACIQKNYPVLKTFVNKKTPDDNSELTAASQLGLALIDISNGRKEEAKQILEKLIKLDWVPKVQAISELVLLQDLDAEESSISEKDKINTLEKLRFRWRGDLLEYQVTRYLIDQLINTKQYPKALSILRKLIRYFPEQSTRDKLPQLMKQQLVSYFSQTPLPKLLELLSVFQEFGDIAPQNAEGDNIMLTATQQMANVDLIDEAITILNDYLATKMQNGDNIEERRANIQLRIAAYKRQMRDLKGSLETLQTISPIPENLKDDINIMKADVLETVGKKEEALSLLELTPHQQLKKGNILFKMDNWKDASSCFEFSLEKKEILDANKQEKVLVNLALCYALLNEQEKLKNLIDNHSKNIKSDSIKNIMKILTLSPSPQQNSSNYFAQIEELASSMKKTLAS